MANPDTTDRADWADRPALLVDDGRRIGDALWERIRPLVPPPPPHPLGCHNPRSPDRQALDAILFVHRHGCRWADLTGRGLGSHWSAHRRFLRWTTAGFFARLQAERDPELDALAGFNWAGPPRRKRTQPR